MSFMHLYAHLMLISPAGRTPERGPLCSLLRSSPGAHKGAWHVTGALYTAVPPPLGDTLQDPQWMSETTESTEPYMHYLLFLYILMIIFNL